MPVRIEAAGDHAFDLPHLRREGGERLVGFLLARAGLPTEIGWQLQVQKKLLCNSETPPVRVVGEPKPWAIYLKIKPGDNNSCHFCSLLMPAGLQGEQVYPALKSAALTFDRNWRNGLVEHPNGLPAAQGPAAAPAPDEGDRQETTPAAAAGGPEGSAKGKGVTKGWLDERDKTRLLLLAIQEINDSGSYPQERFVEILCHKMGWQTANRYEVGGVFTSLTRRDYVIRKLRGSRPFGYELTPQGRELIADLLRPSSTTSAPSPAPPAAAAPADLAELIRRCGPVAKRLVEAEGRLSQIAVREAELTAELQRLRQERDELCRFLTDDGVREIFGRLAHLTRPGG